MSDFGEMGQPEIGSPEAMPRPVLAPSVRTAFDTIRTEYLKLCPGFKPPAEAWVEWFFVDLCMGHPSYYMNTLNGVLPLEVFDDVRRTSWGLEPRRLKPVPAAWAADQARRYAPVAVAIKAGRAALLATMAEVEMMPTETICSARGADVPAEYIETVETSPGVWQARLKKGVVKAPDGTWEMLSDVDQAIAESADDA